MDRASPLGSWQRSPVLAGLRRSTAAFLAEHRLDRVVVGFSGGPDSLALLAAAAGLKRPDGSPFPASALIVDHQLQPDSADMAATALAAAEALGVPARVLAVQVSAAAIAAGGTEAAARRARRAALQAEARGAAILLAHTRDDQAETVLLGLARGSGARSLAGMRPWREPYGRPLLGHPRSETHFVAAELAAAGIVAVRDPMNDDPRFARVRARRRVLPVFEAELGPGIAAALARTATQLAEDDAALSELAAELLREHRGPDPSDIPGEEGLKGDGMYRDRNVLLRVDALAAHPAAIRRRAIREFLSELDPPARLTEPIVLAVDQLITRGAGAANAKGEVAIGGMIATDSGPVRRVCRRRGGTVEVGMESYPGEHTQR